MLRLLVLLLVLLNGMYFAWGQGWLLAYGWGAATQREPQRLAQQVHPEAITLRQAGSTAPQLAAPEVPAGVCLQSAALDAAQAAALRGLLQAALPAAAWTMEALAAPSRWLVYMGKFDNTAEVAKKRAQLAGLGLKYFPLGNAALAPGLSLGSYASKTQAEAALEALKLRGVRSARVLEDGPATASYRLHLQGTPDTLQKPLSDIKAALAGQPLTICASPAPA